MRDRPEHIAKHLERTTIAASGSIAMHQQPRLPPRVTSPTASPNPNSQSRAATAPGPSRPRAESNTSVREAAVSSPAENSPSLGGPPADSIKKLDQIVQNFFNKVAVLVLDARIKVQPVRNSNGLRKTNKWVSRLDPMSATILPPQR
jgi:autophagy-related protein 13